MTYSEFTTTYRSTIKRFPEITMLYSDREEKTITLVKTEYVKIGGRWKESAKHKEAIDFVQYTNIFDFIPLLRNFGGYERTIKGHTKRGYLPIEQISISPNRNKKSVFNFSFM